MKKNDRRITKSQLAIKGALIELMSEKSFDSITIQEIANRANVNRGTIYHHYFDKFDLLDKIIEEHMNIIRSFCDGVKVDYIKFTLNSLLYFEKNISTALSPQNKEIQIHFVANAYVGIVEWWIINNMPIPVDQVSAKVGNLLDTLIKPVLD